MKKILHYFNHLARAWSYLDILTLIRLFVLRKSTPNPVPARIIHGEGQFWYRGFKDKGVMSHFYSLGYHIQRIDGEPLNCIVDLGANIGDETVKFAIRHRRARIFSVEPELENYNLLKKNVLPYGERMIPLHAGIWSKDATLKIVPGDGPEAFSVLEDNDGDILARSMASIISEYSINKIDVLKIDIEGAELELFGPSSRDWLGYVDSIVIEISDWERSGSFQNFFRALDNSGFAADCYINGENIVAVRKEAGLRYCNIIGI